MNRRSFSMLLALSVAAAMAWFAVAGERTMKIRELTAEEERIILQRGTEPPFSGKYHRHAEPGLFLCKRCGAALFRSEDKFDAGCGWPAFDDEVPGAVERQPDPDGERTEIVCSRCGAHLGHVFVGEGFTPRNVRHCVNSISLEFLPRQRVGRAIFAGGCFWGVEYFFERAPGVLSAVSGYSGGRTKNPSYQAVCSHTTGHAEAVEVLYDKQATNFESLARLFFEIHDPTHVDRQGPDVGDQYRSAIFYLDEEQKQTAERLISELRASGLKVATRLEPAAEFWPAEDYHQDYYRKKNSQPYCHRRVQRF